LVGHDGALDLRRRLLGLDRQIGRQLIPHRKCDVDISGDAQVHRDLAAARAFADGMHDVAGHDDEAEHERDERMDDQRKQQAALQRVEPAAVHEAQGEDQWDQKQRREEEGPDAPADARQGAGVAIGEDFARVGGVERVDAGGIAAVGAEEQAESHHPQGRVGLVGCGIDRGPEILDRPEPIAAHAAAIDVELAEPAGAIGREVEEIPGGGHAACPFDEGGVDAGNFAGVFG
jgi:hypothetical protein